MLSTALEKFEKLTGKPYRFLQIQANVAEESKHLLKELYDYTKSKEQSRSKSKALPELIVDEFDEEQIWQELELQNNTKYDNLVFGVSRILAVKDKLCNPLLLKGEEAENELSQSDMSSDDGSEDDDELNEETFNDFEGETEEKTVKKRAKKIEPSIVDDKFFKLRELEEFLDKEDRKESHGKGRKTNDSDESFDEDSVNLFDDASSDEEGGERFHYGEFFDAPEDEEQEERKPRRKEKDEYFDSTVDVDDKQKTVGGDDDLEEYNDDDDGGGDDNEEENAKEDSKKEKQVRFQLSPAPSSDDSGDSDEEGAAKETDNRPKSSFELRQERLRERIKKLEAEALQEKPWQMMGEVSATARPQNSLLEEILEFDSASRPAPVLTEKTTLNLEDIIKNRIKDKVWDDVERKVKPTLAPDEYKKKIVLDQEKSKLSLAEVYEQEYLKQKEAVDPHQKDRTEEETQEHRTIRAMTSVLFAKLDALTNFHYTPQPLIPEIKVVNNLPAITMEEVAPVATSDGALLAPEEVKAKQRGDLMAKEERTKTDKKRDQRKRKTIQRARRKDKEMRERIVTKQNPGLGNKYSKIKAMEMLKKVSNDRNVHQLDDKGDKGVRSSKAFFSRLQEEVDSHIKTRKQGPKTKTKETFSAKRMKL